jgi:hypothetical protein
MAFSSPPGPQVSNGLTPAKFTTVGRAMTKGTASQAERAGAAIGDQMQGVSGDEIFKRNSVFEGPDKQLRIETDDSQTGIDWDRFRRGAAPAKSYSGLPGQAYWDSLGQALDDPELFTLYPDLRHFPLVLDEGLPPSVSGYFDPNNNRIAVRDRDDLPDMAGTLHHEVQHLMQRADRTTGGSNPSVHKWGAMSELDELEPNTREYLIKAFRLKPAQVEMMDKWSGGDILSWVQRGMQIGKAPQAARERIGAEVLTDLRGSKIGPFGKYQRNWGEAEARLAGQRRLDMGGLERLWRNPREDLDVPWDEISGPGVQNALTQGGN